MTFEGLKSLLDKTKRESKAVAVRGPAVTRSSLTKSSEPAPPPCAEASGPDNALARHLRRESALAPEENAQKPTLKRERECISASNETETSPSPLRSREEVHQWRLAAVTALDATLQLCATPLPLPLPSALLHFLDGLMEEGLPETVASEERLLSEDLNTGCGSPPHSGQAVQQRAALLRCMWFLLAAEWRASVTGQLSDERTLDGAGDRVEGYSYAMYWFNAIGGVAPEDVGVAKSIARAAEEWAEHQRERQHAFHLLACVYHDYKAAVQCSKTAEPTEKELVAVSVIPKDIFSGMYDLVVQHLQREGRTMAARQRYADITVGSANWKLGLFGGEVHMRRALERVERHRVQHLLRNETAMNLLYTLHRWINFCEKKLKGNEKRLFCSFAPLVVPGDK